VTRARVRRDRSRSAPSLRRVSRWTRLVSLVMLLLMGHASIAVALDCRDDDQTPPSSDRTASAVMAMPRLAAATLPSNSAPTHEDGMCLCNCGCRHGQVTTVSTVVTFPSEVPLELPVLAVSEPPPPDPVLPLRLRPPLA
jgi:hypothetical protein